MILNKKLQEQYSSWEMLLVAPLRGGHDRSRYEVLPVFKLGAPTLIKPLRLGTAAIDSDIPNSDHESDILDFDPDLANTTAIDQGNADGKQNGQIKRWFKHVLLQIMDEAIEKSFDQLTASVNDVLTSELRKRDIYIGKLE